MVQPSQPPGSPLQPVEVDILLPWMLVRGQVRDLGSGWRLLDLLNTQERILKMSSVRVADWEGNTIALLPDIAVEKHKILTAVPTETEEYKRQRRLARFGLTSPTLKAIEVFALVPPLSAKGTAYVQPNVSSQHLDIVTFGRFFPLTEAVVTLPTKRTIESEIVVISRDQIAAMTVLRG